MAHEATIALRVPQPLIDLHQAAAILSDLAWYIEQAGLSRLRWIEKEQTAVTKVMAEIDEHLDAAGVAEYAQAAILSEAPGESFARFLNVYAGNAHYDTFMPSRL